MANYLGVDTDDQVVNTLTFKQAPADVIQSIYHISVTLSPAAVGGASATTAEQTFTVQGLRVGDVVYVSKPTAQAGLGIVGARVSAANTLAITFVNVTTSAITPTAGEVYQVGGIR
jgi:hypothetical protein